MIVEVMSLLEDVFLQDEANEAAELERVIEGDEFEERRRSDSDENSEKEDEAEEDKRKVDPTKAKTTRVVKNPRFLLNPARLTGPRGIQVIPDHFKDFKFKGKGHEKEDLDMVLKKLEHWAYRLYPKFQFEDCLKKIEMLGKKRPVAVHLHKIRSDQFLSEDTVVQKDSSDEETPATVQEEDEFDKLLQQQIELARSTPAPNSAKKPGFDSSVSPKDRRTTSLMMPKATSSPSINDDQRERMLRSRKMAEERRLARLKNAANTDNTTVNTNSSLVRTDAHPTGLNIKNSNSKMEVSEDISKDIEEIARSKKHNRSNVIDSSDEENVETCVSITVDVHTANKITAEDTVVESEISHNVVNGDSNSNDVGTIMVDNDTERRENTNGNSKLHIIEDNGLIEIDKDNIDNDINACSVDGEHNDTGADGNEELRYDPDMHIATNEHNTSDKNNENIINNEEDTEPKENERGSNDMEDTAKDLDKAPLSSIETNNDENNISDTVPNEIRQNAIPKDNNKTDVSQELIDFMDVDFTEDF